VGDEGEEDRAAWAEDGWEGVAVADSASKEGRG
jgi:hypothetical protein